MRLRLSDYPQLKLIAWSCRGDGFIEEKEAFALYERCWHYVDEASLLPHERELIKRLTQQFGKGVMNV
jgi:hypothetical protein